MKNIFFLTLSLFLGQLSYSQNCNFSIDYNHTQSFYNTSEQPPLSFDFFTNENDGADITDVTWDFGDGTITTGLYTSHVYATAGVYNACFTAHFDDGCESTFCENIIIEAFDYSCISAPFPLGYTPCFDIRHSTDSSISVSTTGLIGSFPVTYIDFGDGQTQNNVSTTIYHDYQQNGNYTLKLVYTIPDSACSDTITRSVIINKDVIPEYIVIVEVSSPDSVSSDNIFFVEIDSSNINDIQLNLVSQQSINERPPFSLWCGGAAYSLYSGAGSQIQMPAASYLVKAAVDSNSINYMSNMPTYYGGSLFWNAAEPVWVSSNTAQFCINLIQGTNPGGPGFIGGSVNEGANKTEAPGDPVAGIEILILNMNNEPVAYTFSDQNGNWMIDNLAFGTYKLYPEVAGLNTEPAIITISASDPGVDNAYISVNADDINVLFTGIDEILNSGKVILSPNPSSGSFNISLDNVKSNEAITINLYNSLGSLIYSEAAVTQSTNFSRSLNLNFPPGIYYLTINTGLQLWTTKTEIY